MPSAPQASSCKRRRAWTASGIARRSRATRARRGPAATAGTWAAYAAQVPAVAAGPRRALVALDRRAMPLAVHALRRLQLEACGAEGILALADDPSFAIWPGGHGRVFQSRRTDGSESRSCCHRGGWLPAAVRVRIGWKGLGSGAAGSAPRLPPALAK